MNATSEFQTKIVHALNAASGQKSLTKSERRKISDLIVAMTKVLLQVNEDPNLKAIYNTYSRSDYDANEDAAKQNLKSMFEEIIGAD